MARLIDAEELMEHSGWYNLVTGKSIHGVQDFEIASMPTIDAVEVVRCRDCKFGEIEEPDFPGQYYCHRGCGWNNEDFYCAHGKRKDDNETTDI